MGDEDEQTRLTRSLTSRNASISDYDLVDVMGRGKFSEVWRAKSKGTGTPVALKKVFIFEMMDATQRGDCMKEVNLMQKLQHPHIVSILDAFLDGNDMVLVLECCEGGDLAGVLQQCAQKKQPLSEAEVWKWFAQVCDAVFHMHSLRMMHRDIKPSNIFVTGTGDVMLGDLGLSRFLSSQTVQVQSMVGTPCYMSPEAIRGIPYDFSSDVWGLGCLLYELVALKNPFIRSGLNYYTLGKKITSCDYEPLPEWASEAVRDTVAWILKADPTARPSVKEVLESVRKRLGELGVEMAGPGQ